MATLNVAGIKSDNILKTQSIYNELKNFDIVCLQETHFKQEPDTVPFNNVFESTFRVFHSVVNENFKGVTVMINRRQLGRNFQAYCEIPGRLLGVKFEFNAVSVLVIGVYAPAQPQHRPLFFNNAADIFGRGGINFDLRLCLGDFNCVPNRVLDRTSQQNNQAEDAGTKNFRVVQNLLDLKDIYREINPDGQDFTFFSKPHRTQARLDRIYGSQTLLDCFEQYNFKTVTFTDHKLTSMTFNLEPLGEPRGPSYWKLNILLLKDAIFCQQIANKIRESDLLNVLTVFLPSKWDILKREIKDMSLRFSKHKAMQRKMSIFKWERELEEAKEKVRVDPDDFQSKNKIKIVLEHLKQNERREIAAIVHKTHYKDICVDRCFLNTAKKLQKRSAEDRHFYALKGREGEMKYKTVEIVDEVKNQIKLLCTREGIRKEDLEFFLGKFGKRVDSTDRNMLDRNLTQIEINEAIRRFQKGKTPGSDGLPIEFYVTFQGLITPILERLFTVCLDKGCLTSTMHYGIISLLYKGKGDKREQGNWRPLTMLNVDYKILAKVLATRLRQVLPGLIHPDQTCAIPGRDIRDGLLSLYNTVEAMKLNAIEGILLSVDHKAAFDVIEWDYIFHCLHKMGFGLVFQKWIKTIYSLGRVRSAVQVNGFISGSFLISRGIRQGCPLSPLLYVLVSEIVTNYIRNEPLIKGISIHGNIYKINSYADDTNFFMKDFKSVNEVLQIYDKYKAASGAALNKVKTQILLLGPGQLSVPAEFQPYVKEIIKIYGVFVKCTGFEGEENWVQVEDALKLKEYKVPTQELSYFGKIGVFMTYTLSKMWYIANLISPSEALCRNLERVLDRYIWYPSERNLIRKGLLKLPHENGGIKYPDIYTRIQAIRIQNLLRREAAQEAQKWHFLFDHYRNETRKVSVRNLKQLRVPNLYKEMRKAEIDFKIEIMGPLVQIYEINYLPLACCLRDIYDIAIFNKFKKELPHFREKWLPMLAEENIFDTEVFSTNKIMYVDGHTRSIHYRTIHSAVFTRDKLSHMVDNVSNKCLLCGMKENTEHVMLHCIRAIRAWRWLEPLFCRILGRNLEEKEKIFGFLIDTNRAKFWTTNVLVQVMQRALHASKFYYEKEGRDKDIFTYFGRKLRLVLSRAHFLSGEWFQKEVLPLLPIKIFSGNIVLTDNFPEQ